jgi:phosphatidylserine/phosphatidylglycerophosphate/cardiolipin synthase-like enzyme
VFRIQKKVFKKSISVPIIVLLLCILSPYQILADKWKFLSDDQEALQCRFDLIQQAEHEILLSYFIFKDDQVGKAIMHLLVEASQKRGVKVKIMVDGHNYKINKKIRAYLASQGVE